MYARIVLSERGKPPHFANLAKVTAKNHKRLQRWRKRCHGTCDAVQTYRGGKGISRLWPFGPDDGTPDEVKISCPVWSGGKPSAMCKGSPIAMPILRQAKPASGKLLVCYYRPLRRITGDYGHLFGAHGLRGKGL